jgi:hypothetical protein
MRHNAPRNNNNNNNNLIIEDNDDVKHSIAEITDEFALKITKDAKLNVNSTLNEITTLTENAKVMYIKKKRELNQKYISVRSVETQQLKPTMTYISDVTQVPHLNTLVMNNAPGFYENVDVIRPRLEKWFQNNQQVMLSFLKEQRNLPMNISEEMMMLFKEDAYYRHYTVSKKWILDSKHPGTNYLSRDWNTNVWRHALNSDGTVNHIVVELGGRGATIRSVFANAAKHVYVMVGRFNMADEDSLNDNQNVLNTVQTLRDRITYVNCNVINILQPEQTAFVHLDRQGLLTNVNLIDRRVANLHDSVYYMDLLKFAVALRFLGIFSDIKFSGHTFSNNATVGEIRGEATWSRHDKTKIRMASNDNCFIYEHFDMLAGLYEMSAKTMILQYTSAECWQIAQYVNNELINNVHLWPHIQAQPNIHQYIRDNFLSMQILFTVNKRFSFDNSDYLQGNISIVTHPVEVIQPSRNTISYNEVVDINDLAKTNNNLITLQYDNTKKIFYHNSRYYFINPRQIDNKNHIIYYNTLCKESSVTRDVYKQILTKFLKKKIVSLEILMEVARDLISDYTSHPVNVIYITNMLMEASSELILNLKLNLDKQPATLARNNIEKYTFLPENESNWYYLIMCITLFGTFALKIAGLIGTSHQILLIIISILSKEIINQYHVFFKKFGWAKAQPIIKALFILLSFYAIDNMLDGIFVVSATIVRYKHADTWSSLGFIIVELSIIISVAKVFKPNIVNRAKNLGIIENPEMHIYKTCVCQDHMLINNIEIDLDNNKLTIAKGYDWIMGIFSNFTDKKDFADFVNGHCNNNKIELAATGIVTPLYTSPIKYYHNCIITLLTAVKRQIAKMPEPEQGFVSSVKGFFKEQYVNKILKLNQKHFNVSFNAWYNHLSKAKQLEIDNLIKDNNLKDGINGAKRLFKECIKYTTFVKGELQLEGEFSKTRNICNVSTWRKLAIGYIIWSIEMYSRKYVEYYASGKSFEAKSLDRAKIIENYGTDVVCLSLDFSAFDSTQHISWKRAIDDALYTWAIKTLIVNKAQPKYFSFEDALNVATNHDAKLQVGQYIDGKFKPICKIFQRGTVHSGDPDTTLGNTWRTLVMFHYLLEKVLKLNKVDYTIRSSGDDVDLYIRKSKYKEIEVKQMFNKYFVNKNTFKIDANSKTIHGSGMMMKMVDVFTGAESESCSTFAFATESNKVCVIRQPHRFVKTLTYLDKNCILNPSQYLNAIAQCNLAWGHCVEGINFFLTKLINITEKTVLPNKNDDSRIKLEVPEIEQVYLDLMDSKDIENKFSIITSNPYKYGEKILKGPKDEKEALEIKKASKLFLEKYYDIDDEDILNLEEVVNTSDTYKELFYRSSKTRFFMKLGNCVFIPKDLMKNK